jgi:lipopolysaccharide biosynthesis protein
MNSHEHTNKKQIQNLCQLLDINYEKYNNGQFFAGTMFFGRVPLFQQYFNTNTLPILSDLLKNEIGHVTDCLEGKYCHALERIFGYLVSANSLEFRFCIEEKLKILNNLAPNKKLHIIRLYNNHCYAEEDIHVYGHILKETESLITIKWWHLKNPVTKDYKKINSNTLVRIP